MNSNFNDRSEGNFETRRSERYRHPERDRHRFDDYGSPARGGYGNQDNEIGGSRHVPNRGMNSDTYSTSRNYGNMGSYGGAQGFGSERGGYASQHPDESRAGYNYYSGMGSPGQARRSNPNRSTNYGGGSNYRSDDHRGNRDFGRNRNDRDRYDSDPSGRYHRSDRGHYGFDEDNYNAGSGAYRGSSRGGYGSPNYGGYEGNYMGSGYSRSSRGDYGSYGDSGYSNEPYGMSGYYSGGYGDRNQGWDDNRSSSHYFKSENRGRTFDRDSGGDRGRSYGERR